MSADPTELDTHIDGQIKLMLARLDAFIDEQEPASRALMRTQRPEVAERIAKLVRAYLTERSGAGLH